MNIQVKIKGGSIHGGEKGIIHGYTSDSYGNVKAIVITENKGIISVPITFIDIIK